MKKWWNTWEPLWQEDQEGKRCVKARGVFFWMSFSDSWFDVLPYLFVFSLDDFLKWIWRNKQQPGNFTVFLELTSIGTPTSCPKVGGRDNKMLSSTLGRNHYLHLLTYCIGPGVWKWCWNLISDTNIFVGSLWPMPQNGKNLGYLWVSWVLPSPTSCHWMFLVVVWWHLHVLFGICWASLGFSETKGWAIPNQSFQISRNTDRLSTQ